MEQVAWEGRILPFNTTAHTDYSKWLNINGINRFFTDFDVDHPTQFTVTFKGWINEPCPAQWQFNNRHIMCEYVLHGRQSQDTCCPHGLTTKGPFMEDCGCRDDTTETPYRMAYQSANSTEETTTYILNLALVEAWRTQDFDGVDFQFTQEVNCSAMTVTNIKLDVFSYHEIIAVRFNNATLDWQLTPNTPFSNWLWVLGVDYTVDDLIPYRPVTVEVRCKRI